MQAVDSNPSQALTFTATGLPPGIKIASNGTISGVRQQDRDLDGDGDRDRPEGVSGAATFVWSVVR